MFLSMKVLIVEKGPNVDMFIGDWRTGRVFTDSFT